MKKNLLKLATVIAVCLSTNTMTHAQTDGTLTVTFTETAGTTTSNVYAVWIENNAGTFIKTKIRYVGGGTDDHLPTWMSKSSGGAAATALDATCNITDATTGTTRKSTTTPTGMGVKTLTWDGKNVAGAVNGSLVTDGIYKVWVETAWSGSTAAGAHGSITSWSFTKGAVADHQTPANQTITGATFASIDLLWTPNTVGLNEVGAVKPQLNAYPNPSTGLVTVSTYQANNIKVMNTIGEVIFDKNLDANTVNSQFDLSGFANGLYVVTVTNENGSTSQKVLLDK